MADAKTDRVLARLAELVESRRQADPGESYVAKLLKGEEDALLKKIGEEATETVLAAKSGDRLHLVRETADLWFHSLIVLARHGLGPQDVLAELQRREGISGLDEKAARRSSEREASTRQTRSEREASTRQARRREDGEDPT